MQFPPIAKASGGKHLRSPDHFSPFNRDSHHHRGNLVGAFGKLDAVNTGVALGSDGQVAVQGEETLAGLDEIEQGGLVGRAAGRRCRGR